MRDLFKSLFLALTAGVLFSFTACVTDAGGKKDDGGSTSTLTEVSITVSANSIAATGSVALTAVPSPSDISADYTWSIESGSDYAALSATSGKTVTLTGTNTTSSNQSVKVKVIATSGSVTKSTDTTITVQAVSQTQTAELKSVSISGTTEIEAAGTGTLSATPVYTGDIASQISYSWEITSGDSYATISGNGASATITGKNTTTSSQSVTVKVTATYGTTSITATQTVTVAAVGVDIPDEITGLELIASSASVAPDGTVTLTPAVSYTGSVSESQLIVSGWDITAGGSYASLKVPSTGAARSVMNLTGDNTSILQANNTSTSAQTVTATVTVSFGGVTKSAACTVTAGAASVDSVSISGTTTLTACNGTTTLNADVSKTGNPANITYNWEITDGSDYAEITAGVSTAQITLTGTNETSSARTVTVKVTVSDGTNSVTNTQTVRVPKNPNNTTKPALFPENGSTDAYADTQLVLTFTSTPTLVSGNSVKIYTSTGTLVDTINILPTSDDTQIPQTGSSYTANVGNQQLVRVSGNSVYIQPHYNGSSSATKLSYGTDYYVEIDKSAITTSGTLAGGTAWNGFSGSSGWTFTTKAAPAISTSSAITVSNDTSSTDADFFSVYGALCATAKKSSGTYEIDIAATEDPYYELISVQSSGANVILKGQGSETYGSDVVIEYVNNVYMNNSTHTRAVFYYKGSGDLTLENITIKNLTERNVSYTADGLHASSEFQAEALTFYTSGNLAVYNSSFISKQDTILLNSGRAWFYKSHIEGDVDFIWGSATAALFEECEIESILTEKSAYLTETRVGTVGASTVGKGYVFLNSTIKGNGGSNATYLSRLASGNAKSSPSKTTYDQVAFINSTFESSAKVNSDLWVATDSKYPRFIEKDSSGNVNVGWKTYGNTGITPVTTEYAGEITSSLYAMEYNGRYAILNRLYNVDYEAYQTNSSVWSLTSLESEFSASADASKNNAFTEPDTSISTTIKWDFTTIASGTTYEGKTGTFAATAGTGTLYVDATSGKIATRGTDAQFNSGTIAYIPASVGDTVSVTLYYGNYTLGSTTVSGKTTEITVTASDLTTYNSVSCVALTATGDEYLYLISVVPGDSGDSETTWIYNPSNTETVSAVSSDTASTDTENNTSVTLITGAAVNSTSVTDSEGTSYSKAVNLSGTGSVSSKAVKFSVSGKCTVYVVTRSTGNSARTLNLSDGTSILTTFSAVANSETPDVLSYSYTGSSGYLYLYSAGSGINVYFIKTIYGTSSGTASLSSVTISGNSSVLVGSSITLTATPDVTPADSTYTWTLASGSDYVTLGSSTTNTVTVTGVSAGSATITATVDGVTSSAYTVTAVAAEDLVISDGSTIKDSDTTSRSDTLTITKGETPTGYAGVGYSAPSYTTVTVTTAADLVSYAKKGGYFIIVDGMIDMTTRYNGSTMLPEVGGGTTTALDAFVNEKSSGEYSTYLEWQAAYAASCSLTTEDGESDSGNSDLFSMLWTLNNAYKNIIQLKVVSNTAIVGKDADSGIRGAAISISDVSNVVLRNLNLSDSCDPFPHHEVNSSGSSDGYNAQHDCICIQGDSSYIWIDHCTLEDTYTLAHVKTGGTSTEKWQTYDGLLDIKGNGQYITVSYCKFKNHDKTSLIGNTDSTEKYTPNGSSSSTTITAGWRKITYHHNYFYNCGQRLPMVRYTTMHLYNNLYESSSPYYTQQYAVGVRTGSIIYSEYNYFGSGILYAFSGDSSSSKVGKFYSYGDEAYSTVTLYNSSKGISASNGDTLFSAGPAAYTYSADTISAITDGTSGVPQTAGTGAVTIIE